MTTCISYSHLDLEDTSYIGTDPGADVKTDSNHHETTVEAVESDNADKPSFEERKLITRKG